MLCRNAKARRNAYAEGCITSENAQTAGPLKAGRSRGAPLAADVADTRAQVACGTSRVPGGLAAPQPTFSPLLQQFSMTEWHALRGQVIGILILLPSCVL